MSSGTGKSTNKAPSGSWLFNDAAFGQRLPRSRHMLKADELTKILPSKTSSVERLVHGRRPAPSTTRAKKKRRTSTNKLAATTGNMRGKSITSESVEDIVGSSIVDDEEERLYARLGLDPADEALIRRVQDKGNAVESQKKRALAWEKFQNERKAQAKRASKKGQLDPGIKFDSVKAKEDAEAEARRIAEEEAKAERLRERREEERAAKAEVAAQMGMTLEEMEAMESAAEEGTDEIIKEYEEAFKRIDKDGSGCLSPDELRELVHELGDDVTEEDLEAMIKEADKDGDGEIDMEEFTNMMRARKRVTMLAAGMTKAHKKPHPETDTGRERSFSMAGSVSGVSEAESGDGMEYYSLGEHKFPLGGPSLPPLQIGKALASKRNLRKASRLGVVDEYYSRPTPHVLKVGAAASADDLRIQLGRAQRLMKVLDRKVEEGIEWVQANCPVTNIRAQQYCQKWGLEKLEHLFNKIAYQKLIAVFRKWEEVIEYEKNQEKVDNYMKWKGSRRLIKMVQEWDLKQQMSAWDKWHHTVQHMRYEEQGENAIQIQKIARGYLARQRVGRMRKNFAAIQIQRVGRGMLGRKVASEKRWHKKRHDAACVIQNRWRGFEGRQLAKVIAKKKRELDAANTIQRAWRGYKGRSVAKVVARKRLENQMACRIQNLWRTRAARRLVSAMRAAIAEEEAALYIQSWWRGILGAREGMARMMARRRIILRENSALKIQGAWRCYEARLKVEHRKLERAALRVQCAWRAKNGRMAYHLKKQAKMQIEREEREAAEAMQKMLREQAALKRIKEQEEEESAAKKIQGRFRVKAAKKDLASRRYQAQQRKLGAEQMALENRMALRIQCAWRGRKGRLSTHLKLQARKAREQEERQAALTIQTRFRGAQGRAAFLEKKATKAEKLARERAAQEKADREEMNKAATKLQSSWRGHEARADVETRKAQMKARQLLEEKERHEEELAAMKMKEMMEQEQARKDAADKKAKAMAAALKAQQEEERRQQELMALKMQNMLAKQQADKELEEQKRRHEEELANAKDDATRQAMREKQERELAALKIQQMYRRRQARQEIVKRKAEAEKKKREAAAEAERHRREFAAMKIQTCMRQYLAKKAIRQKRKVREDKLAAMRQAELDKIEMEQAALKIQSQFRGVHAKREVQERRKALEDEHKKLEEEAAEKEEEEAAALKIQSVFRRKEAKAEVDDKRRQHALEMEELKKQNVHQKELDALREKQEQELAAMKLQSLYRGRKARRDLIKIREHRKAEMRVKKRELERNISATKIQGMYRCYKARQMIRAKKANLQARWDVSATTSTFSSPTPLNPDQSMKTNHAIPPFFFSFICVLSSPPLYNIICRTAFSSLL
jgi:hypothetical protein